MKTDLELKKMLAEELPELISYYEYTFWWIPHGNVQGSKLVTDREWLWIVAECEKKLSDIQRDFYIDTLIDSTEVQAYAILATWQQRAIEYFKMIGKL